MKRMFVVCLLLLISVNLVTAQEEPIPPKRQKAGKMGALIGFTSGWLFLDAAPINKFLTAGKAASVSENGVFLKGGAGAAYIMLFKNVRVGGVGMSGSVTSSITSPDNIKRDAELSAGYGGVTFEYVQPIVPRLDIAAGVMLGWGGVDLTVRKSNGTASTWTGEQAALDTAAIINPGNLTRKYSGNFFVWIPSVNLEFAILPYLGLRLGASYVGMVAPSWKVDDDFDLSGVPSEVSGKGFQINAGLFIGSF